MYLFAQNGQNTQNNFTVTDEAQIVLTAPEQTNTTVVPQTSTFWLFVRMVLVLMLAIAGVYGVLQLAKNRVNPTQKEDPYLKTVAQTQLSAGKNCYVVTIGAQAFLIGTAENAISLIAEITDKELVDAMNLNAEKEPAGIRRDFASIFSRFLGAKSKQNPFSAVDETQEFLRRRRTNLAQEYSGEQSLESIQSNQTAQKEQKNAQP